MHDRQNKELEVGQRVAYNLSGGIALGEIVAIRSKKDRPLYGGKVAKGFNIFIKPDSAWSKIASSKGYSTIVVWTTYGDLVDKIVVL